MASRWDIISKYVKIANYTAQRLKLKWELNTVVMGFASQTRSIKHCSYGFCLSDSRNLEIATWYSVLSLRQAGYVKEGITPWDDGRTTEKARGEGTPYVPM